MVERGEDKFYYNETELYEALNECNEDFIVVGNLKSSTFSIDQASKIIRF